MEKVFLTIDELSQYLGIKKSNLYAKVERREILKGAAGKELIEDRGLRGKKVYRAA